MCRELSCPYAVCRAFAFSTSDSYSSCVTRLPSGRCQFQSCRLWRKTRGAACRRTTGVVKRKKWDAGNGRQGARAGYCFPWMKRETGRREHPLWQAFNALLLSVGILRWETADARQAPAGPYRPRDLRPLELHAALSLAKWKRMNAFAVNKEPGTLGLCMKCCILHAGPFCHKAGTGTV